MTQLVELQEALPKFHAAGLKLYAISYDEQDALADFARHHGITFPLLSDVDSEVIRSYGVLNDQIEKHEIPFFGVPYPGTFVLDEDGVVIDKLFNSHWSNRSSAESAIDAALGEILLGDDEPSATATADDVEISATYHGGSGRAKLGMNRELVVRFDLAPGLHIYDDPVPDGMVATRIEVNGPVGVHVGAVAKPETHALALPGLAVDLNVWDGRVDFTMPIRIDDNVTSALHREHVDHVDLDVNVRYQMCNDKACRLPSSESLSVRVPVAELLALNVESLGLRAPGVTLTTMNTRKHILKLAIRSLRHRPVRGLRYGVKSAIDTLGGPFGRGGTRR